MAVTLNLITRGRPHLIGETIERTLENIADPFTKYVISVDDDDPETIEVANKYQRHCIVLVAPREDTMGEKIDRALKVPGSVYLTQVDYAPILTKGFDIQLLDAEMRFPDGIGYIHSHLANLSFPSLIAITHKTVECTGNLGPAYFPYWFWDHWSTELAKRIGRIAYVEFEVDHYSRRTNTTMELRDLEFWATFYDAMAFEREREANALLGKMVDPDWHKDLLRNQWPLIHQWSCIINNMARRDAAEIEAARNPVPADDRYKRIKKNAENVLRARVAELKRAA